MILFLVDFKYCLYMWGSMLIMNEQGIQDIKQQRKGKGKSEEKTNQTNYYS